ncbi:choice-of-anchor L domain-containing protein [Flavobacterium sp. XGLA_31]|uniref:choice-of-anchor L domain-containing protein n=1 Tax=Flavobacterium sp. XGLA_31 TaxID=3447666 RepID=UPI003F312A30
MKKITFLLLLAFISINGYAQLSLEGFESTTGPDALPDTNWTLGTGNWAVFDNGIGTGQRWGINSTIATPPLVYQGSNAAYVRNENIGAGNTSEDYLATPLVTIPANGQLHFYTRTFTSGVQGTLYQIKIAPAIDASFQTDPSAYSLVQQWTENELTTTFNIYQEKIVDLSAYAGLDVYVAFVMVYTQPDANLGGDRWLIDNVNIVEKCTEPNNLTAGGITQTSANLGWGNPGGAASFEIEIVNNGATPSGIGTPVTGTSYPATATTLGVNFTPTTTYQFYVRAVCSQGNSIWVGPQTFTTTSPGIGCNAPITIVSLPYTTTDNTSNYSDNPAIEGTPGATGCGSTNAYLNGNDVVYAYTATTSGTINVNMVPTATYSGIFAYSNCSDIGVSCLNGVANAGTAPRTFDLPVVAGNTYYFVISTWATPQTTGYTLTIQAVNCPPPSTLSASNIGQTTAELSWVNPGATSWQVAVQPAGSPIPTGAGVTANTNTNFVVSGLTAATAYQYYVRSDCGDGTFSVWSGPYLFNTTICDVSQQCNYTFRLVDSFGDGWNGGTMQVRQNGIVVATLTGPTAAQGTTPVNVTVTMCDNVPFDLFWNTAGTFPGEMGVTIINSFNQTLFVKAPGTGTAGTVLYNNTVHCLVPECLPPTALTATFISETEATLGWTTTGPETAWQVIVLPAGSPVPNASTTGWVDAPTNPFVYTGLTAATAYSFYVRPVCSDTNIGGWSSVKNFNTTICPLSQQCNYSFTMIDSFGDGWNGGTMQVRQNGIVVATLTGPTDADNQNPITVTVPMCDGIPYDLFWNAAGAFPGEMGVSVINSFGQTLFVKNPGSGTSGTVLYTNTVNCSVPECLAPTALTATFISNTDATLGWSSSGPETSWQVLVLPAGSPAPNASTTGWTDAPTNPFVYTGLTAGTSYDFYVRPVCSVTNIGSWSAVKNFTTSLCPLADQCNYTFNMSDSFGDGWNGGTMQVRQNGIVIATLTGPTAAQGTSTVSVTVPLCHGIPFELFWSTAGTFQNEIGITIQEALAPQEVIFTKPFGTGTPGTVLFSGTAECIPPTCPKPNSLVIAPITQTGATVTWTEAGTASQWEVLILPSGSPAPNASTSGGILVTTNSYTFANLIPATGYDVYVRAICSATDISFWSNVKSFTTLIANDECDFATVVPVNPTIECIQTAPGSLLGATASLQSNTCGGTDDDDVWFQFTATSAQHAISLLNVNGSTTDLFHAVYTGTNCGSLTQLYCSDPNSSIATNLTVGQTYYIRVYSWTATPGQTTTFDVCVATIPPPIITNNTLYTTQQLVEDVFLNSSCASVSNVTSSTGTNFGSTNGIAYFNQNGSGFPFSDGIVLTSGNALNAPGPNSTTLSDGANTWPGDAQLEAIILAATGNPMNSENATKLEFDFIPLVDTINFNFVFASEEYGTFQCDYSDAFAFLLTDIATGTTTNLAVVPNTTTPVSVVTIRDNQFNNGCGSVNPEYFGDFYGAGGLDPLGSPTNFNGSTVPLTATSTVIPGNQYHIKLVIADRLDNLYDSAVFLEGGSLNIGNIDLGTDFLQATNNALCFGESYTIQSGLNPALYNFTWTFNGNPIPNETGPNLTITEPGDYGISAQYINTTCAASDTITIEYYSQLVTGTPNDLIACSNTGTAEFDLSQNNASALGTLDPASYNVSYYMSQADAMSETNVLPTLYTNTSNPQTIYVRVENNLSGCYEVRSFQLIVNSLTTTLFTIDTTICENETAPVLPTTSDNGVAGTWSPSVVSNTLTADYVFTPNSGTCGTAVTITVTVTPLIPSTFATPATICSGASVPALPANSIEGTAGTWNPSTVDNTQTATYTFTPNAGQCATTGSLTINVNQPITPTFDSVAAICNGAALTALPTTSLNGYTGTWSPALDNTVTTTYTFTPNANQCASNTTLTITVNPKNPATFDAIAPLCIGENAPMLPNTSLEGYTGTWSPATVNTNTTGTYLFTPDVGQCAANGSLTITVLDGFDFALDGACIANQFTVTVSAVNNSFDLNTANYAWFNSNLQSIGTNANTFDVTAYLASTPEQETLPVTFTATVTTADGCALSHDIIIKRVFCEIQKGISANNDGDNDFFDLTGYNVKELTIYNRFGMKVYSRANYSNQWIGQSDAGDELPDGTYYYVIDLNDNQSAKTGWIYINRKQ